MNLIQSSLLKSLPFLTHGFFGPDDPESKADNLSYQNGEVDQVRAARERACGLIGVAPGHLTHVYQEHGVEIFAVTQSQRGAGALQGEGQVGHGDGMITADAETPLAILVADCIPLYFAARGGEAIGLAHAGWRGTYKGIAPMMAQRMTEEFGIQPSDLLVWIGPGISFDAFEVGEDVWAYFWDGWSHYMDCFDRDERLVDLKGLCACQLIEAGVPEANIEISEECTVENERLYSYRRQGEGCGHNMAVIMKK